MKPVKSPRALRIVKIYYYQRSGRYVAYYNSGNTFTTKAVSYRFKQILRVPGEPVLTLTVIFDLENIYEVDRSLQKFLQLFRNNDMHLPPN